MTGFTLILGALVMCAAGLAGIAYGNREKFAAVTFTIVAIVLGLVLLDKIYPVA